MGNLAVPTTPENANLPLGNPEEALLVVDDDPTARQLTVLAAKELGYPVLEADGGQSAIELLKEHLEVKLY